MHARNFGQLLADREKRIERGHRILENHRDPIAADVGQFVLRQFQQIATLKPCGSAENLCRRHRQQAEHRQARHAFARTAFANDAKRFARLDG